MALPKWLNNILKVFSKPEEVEAPKIAESSRDTAGNPDAGSAAKGTGSAGSDSGELREFGDAEREHLFPQNLSGFSSFQHQEQPRVTGRPPAHVLPGTRADQPAEHPPGNTVSARGSHSINEAESGFLAESGTAAPMDDLGDVGMAALFGNTAKVEGAKPPRVVGDRPPELLVSRTSSAANPRDSTNDEATKMPTHSDPRLQEIKEKLLIFNEYFNRNDLSILSLLSKANEFDNFWEPALDTLNTIMSDQPILFEEIASAEVDIKNMPDAISRCAEPLINRKLSELEIKMANVDSISSLAKVEKEVEAELQTVENLIALYINEDKRDGLRDKISALNTIRTVKRSTYNEDRAAFDQIDKELKRLNNRIVDANTIEDFSKTTEAYSKYYEKIYNKIAKIEKNPNMKSDVEFLSASIITRRNNQIIHAGQLMAREANSLINQMSKVDSASSLAKAEKSLAMLQKLHNRYREHLSESANQEIDRAVSNIESQRHSKRQMYAQSTMSIVTSLINPKSSAKKKLARENLNSELKRQLTEESAKTFGLFEKIKRQTPPNQNDLKELKSQWYKLGDLIYKYEKSFKGVKKDADDIEAQRMATTLFDESAVMLRTKSDEVKQVSKHIEEEMVAHREKITKLNTSIQSAYTGATIGHAALDAKEAKRINRELHVLSSKIKKLETELKEYPIQLLSDRNKSHGAELNELKADLKKIKKEWAKETSLLTQLQRRVSPSAKELDDNLSPQISDEDMAEMLGNPLVSPEDRSPAPSNALSPASRNSSNVSTPEGSSSAREYSDSLSLHVLDDADIHSNPPARPDRSTQVPLAGSSDVLASSSVSHANPAATGSVTSQPAAASYTESQYSTMPPPPVKLAIPSAYPREGTAAKKLLENLATKGEVPHISSTSFKYSLHMLSTHYTPDNEALGQLAELVPKSIQKLNEVKALMEKLSNQEEVMPGLVVSQAEALARDIANIKTIIHSEMSRTDLESPRGEALARLDAQLRAGETGLINVVGHVKPDHDFVGFPPNMGAGPQTPAPPALTPDM